MGRRANQRLWKLLTLLLTLLVSGCFGGPGFFKNAPAASVSKRSSGETPLVTLEKTQVDGAIVASVAANSLATQVVEADQDTVLSGTSVAFPPGSLAINTSITIEEASAVATDAVVSQLGLESTFSSVGTPLLVSSSVPMDTVKPFTIALALPEGAALRLTGDLENLIVVY